MKHSSYDVIVIGAGPAGTVAASLLIKRGWRVLILEKEEFPRFSIGESLLPQCMSFLKEAGLLEALESQADGLSFQFKNGAAFHKQGQDSQFDFTQKFSDGPGTTFQVKRADFDHLLAEASQQKGVEIQYQTRVTALDVEATRPKVWTLDSKGIQSELECGFVLDASGFGRVLPRLLALDAPSSFPVRQSLFTHVTDRIEDSGFDRNKILITVHPQRQDVWYWLIPFADGTASVGVVGEAIADAHQDPEPQLLGWLNQAPNLRKLLARATVSAPVRNISGYTAAVTRLYGSNYALLGNAGEFLDPVFSSGVTIAMQSASLVAPQVDAYLRGQEVDFDSGFAKPLVKGIDCFRAFVRAWYDGRFQDVIFYQQQDDRVRRMISAILAGYAWDESNPYVAQSERRLDTLVRLCQSD
ncbi:NAD(P)/FAD-dependent oxidoreductase [Lacimicrobium sp. SS2-24]|uniref:NAD(P)/FAD-dependent oxidoreductase n=1 Tax=Lacimicrobium sp. SS2-24 TaxID=2005569 RepID=UPI000B4AA9A1|nr:NAD(P)/FAD-dependent oxidoreductase [Lacimicrobium sp. SS2-24]